MGGDNRANEWQVSRGRSRRRCGWWWNHDRRDNEVKTWRREGAQYSHQQCMCVHWWWFRETQKTVQCFIRWDWMEKIFLTTGASSFWLLRFRHVGWVFPELFKRRLFFSRPVFMAWMAKLFFWCTMCASINFIASHIVKRKNKMFKWKINLAGGTTGSSWAKWSEDRRKNYSEDSKILAFRMRELEKGWANKRRWRERKWSGQTAEKKIRENSDRKEKRQKVQRRAQRLKENCEM